MVSTVAFLVVIAKCMLRLNCSKYWFISYLICYDRSEWFSSYPSFQPVYVLFRFFSSASHQALVLSDVSKKVNAPATKPPIALGNWM
jgi:hypothetical protein